jgi:hypothetical protein
MSDIEIEIEFMTAQYHSVLQKGREPEIDEFDTFEIDEAIERWAEEDDELLDALASRDNPDVWEKVI